MAVVKCEKGHFYDNSKFDTCPHCENPMEKRRTISDEFTQYMPKPSSVIGMKLPGADDGDEKTVGIFRAESGIEPVVAWLVCVQGVERGRAYLLYAGRNFVGRSVKSDVCIADDREVSGEDHCSIVFEPRRIVYMIARGNGESVLIDGKPLQDSCMLQGEEEIQIGSSRFIFIPYCKEGRTW
ncbi:MAG: FHA domain-containing protein [Eubacteriales bacterium]